MLPRCLLWRKFAFFTLVLIAIAKKATAVRYSSRIVEIQTGAIRGIILELNSRHLEPVEVFRGVPYAAPPVGPLRFRAPQPPLPWPGTRLADTFGSVCPQRYPDITNRTAALQHMPKGRYQYLKKLIPLLVNQSEDCLFLNIYVPGSGNRGLEAPYAVLVLVHGESFEWGAGHPYDGSVLASYGHVIVVTLNFRLGILGFLRTKPNTPVARGQKSGDPKKEDSDNSNLGIKDISLALRWIKTNIAAFGGDPSRVTLIGHDTGAALVNLLFISSSSKGLFKRVVLLSGTALSPWATVHNTENLRISVAQQTGCLHSNVESETETNTDTNVDIADCLRTRPLQALMDVDLETVRFMPRIAPSLPLNSETPDPAYAMEHASENFITSELMLGVTTTESYTDFNANDIQYGFEEDQRNRVLRTYIRNAYLYHLNEIFSAVRNEYTDWDKPIQHPINIRDSTMEALSDGHTVSPLIRVAYLHARRGAKTYLFHFGYQTKESDYPQRLGSIRGEALTYLLGLPLIGGQPNFPANYTRQDTGVAEAALVFFANFAKSGDPNAPGGHRDVPPDYGTARERTRYRGLTWEPYEIGTQFYLSITLKPKMKSHYRGHKMAVWLNLIPQLHQPGDEDINMRHHHFHEREPHYYAGSVRAESFTKLPPSIHPASITDLQISAGSSNIDGSDCISTTTSDDVSDDDDLNLSEEDEESDELLQRLATRHYYSYTAALGVTVGVGCLLLVLNMLIFAGIYYQRERDRRRQVSNRNSRTSSSPSTETIPMSQRPSTPGSSARQSPTNNIKEKYEFPPCYNTLSRSLSIQDIPQITMNSMNTLKKEKPPPPVRTSSNPPGGTVKKRVQIQEIAV
ncbi:neuroligin-1-like [Aethina tumida]|uniref:neuroligin-1-like n=1 Tax=Aethina tumida TaxID=116153 RepID=UPI002148847D|nr:neuroligin-1-like [Aethina tumida]